MYSNFPGIERTRQIIEKCNIFSLYKQSENAIFVDSEQKILKQFFYSYKFSRNKQSSGHFLTDIFFEFERNLNNIQKKSFPGYITSPYINFPLR